MGVLVIHHRVEEDLRDFWVRWLIKDPGTQFPKLGKGTTADAGTTIPLILAVPMTGNPARFAGVDRVLCF